MFTRKQPGQQQSTSILAYLVLVVLLPNVCLLWFMSTAARNEQLALRQHWADYYTQQVRLHIITELEEQWQAATTKLAEVAAASPATRAGQAERCAKVAPPFAGVLIYDQEGRLLYPTTRELSPAPLPDDPNLQRAQQLEFIDGKTLEAQSFYERVTVSQREGSSVWRHALLGRIRCLRDLGQLEKAIELSEELASPPSQHSSNATQRLHAKLQRVALYRQTLTGKFQEELQRQLDALLSSALNLKTDTRAFALNQLIQHAQALPLTTSHQAQWAQARQTLADLELILDAAENFADSSTFAHWTEGVLHSVEADSELYCVPYYTSSHTILGLVQKSTMNRLWIQACAGLIEEDILLCVRDDRDHIMAGSSSPLPGDPFLSMTPGAVFANWRLELCFPPGRFGAIAQQRRQFYLVTATLVLGFTVILALIIVRRIGKQVRLNRLKNDFIATVTHELKTPLASTRLLVETILAGNCQDPQEEREFLELIAKENQRLSRLIDNFLCFSRMERHKQALDLVPTAPDSLAEAAAEAVRPRFKEQDCQLTVHNEEDLPQVMADPDAIVRALVNLFDNACKYSQEKGDVELRVYRQEQNVCFAVTDHGIGMTAREIKRAFDRFYQADNSLTRRHAGCGLGLSIVKFIVDSHHGQINVKSKPGEGTTFTIVLPLAVCYQKD